MKATLPTLLLMTLSGSCSSATPISKGPSGAAAAPELLRFENGVRSILEDSQGNFWFGSHNEGVARFDGAALTYFNEDDGLSGNQVRSIHEDQAGLIWFESGNGLSSFDGERITTRTDKNYASRQAWQKSEHGLWFKGDEAVNYNQVERNPGAYRYAGQGLTYLEFPRPRRDRNEQLLLGDGHRPKRWREHLVCDLWSGDRLRRP